MEPFWFEYNCMKVVCEQMEKRLPAPCSCTDDELNEMWEKLLEEYDFMYEQMGRATNPDGVTSWKMRIAPIEKELDIVDSEWKRRHPYPWQQEDGEESQGFKDLDLYSHEHTNSENIWTEIKRKTKISNVNKRDDSEEETTTDNDSEQAYVTELEDLTM